MINLVAALLFIIGLVVEEYFAGAVGAMLIYLFNSNRRLKKRVAVLELDAETKRQQPNAQEQHSPEQQILLNEQYCQSDDYQPGEALTASSLNANVGLSGIDQPDNQSEQMASGDAASVNQSSEQPTVPITKHQSESSFVSSNLTSKLVKSAMASIFGPVAGIFDSFLKIYRHYRDQDKAPVFFLTLAGITTLIIGFGYLLQFSFNEYLSPAGKVSLAYLFAMAVMVVAITIYRKRPKMSEFAASLIGLSLVLLYVCSYFLGSYHQLTSDTITFILLAAITAGGYVLAKLFETRVVALLSLVGGAAAPALITGAASGAPLLYLTYLCLICAAALPLAFTIRWQLLAQISFVTGIAFVEYTLVKMTFYLANSFFSLVLIHAFFYLLCSNVYLQWTKFSAKRSAVLIQLSAALLFMLLALEQITVSSSQYGALLLFNAAIAIAIFFVSKLKTYPHSVDVSVFSLLSSGFFAGIALLVLTAPELLSLIWGFEGVLLLYLGLYFSYPSVRKEAFVLLTIAAMTALVNTLMWLADSIQPLPVLMAVEFNAGYLNLVSLLAVTLAISNLLSRYFTVLTALENTLNTCCLQLSYALMSVVSILTMAGIWPSAFWLLSIIPLFLLVYISDKNHWPAIEKFALGHWFLLVVPIAASAIYVGNFHFGEQHWIAKFAIVEAFAGLWAIAYFYRRFAKLSPIFQQIQRLDTLFYLTLPVFFLPSVLHRAPEMLALAVWISATISVLIYFKLPRPALLKMAKVLVYGAAFASLLSCYLTEFSAWQGHSVSPLLLGVCLLILLSLKIKAFSPQPTLNKTLLSFKNDIISLFIPSIIYWGLSIMIVVYGFSGELTYALISAMLYCIGLIWFANFRVELKQHYGRIIYCIWTLCLYSTLSIWATVLSGHQLDLGYMISVCVPVIVATVFIAYSDQQMFVLARRLAKSNQLSIILCHGCLTVLYLSVIYFWQASLMGPFVSILLVIHGTNLLFHTLKAKYQWLMPMTIGYFVVATAKVVMWDISDLSIVQKILAFMLIGSILLVAAYQYQKLKARNQQ